MFKKYALPEQNESEVERRSATEMSTEPVGQRPVAAPSTPTKVTTEGTLLGFSYNL